MKYNFFKNRFIYVVIIAVVFGFGAGMVGYLFSRVYLFENILNIPLYGEINLTNGIQGNTNLIIRDAKKVVVEQDNKINDSIINIKNNIVGIFQKQTQEQSSSLYYVKDEVAQGVALTSDGWILSDLGSVKINEKILDNFFIASADGEIYAIDKIFNDKYSSYSFLHISDVKGLPVTQFVPMNDINQGSTVIVFDWDQNSIISSVSGKKNQKILSSDILNDEYLLSSDLSEYKSSFVYNLSGQFLGIVGEDNFVYPVYNLKNIIDEILSGSALTRIKMGLHYIDLTDFISRDLELKGVQIVKNTKNISIEKDSPAFLSELKENDIIYSIDDVELNEANKLNFIIQKYKKGDSLNVSFLRKGKKYNTNLILDEY